MEPRSAMEGGFVPHAASRIRLARGLFLGVCLMPSAGLVGWGWHLRGESYRDRALAGAAVALGRPVTAARLEHAMPGVIQLSQVRMAPDAAAEGIEIERVRVERAGAELRVTVPGWRGTLEGVRSAAAILGGWLHDPLRHSHDWIIAIGPIVVEPEGQRPTIDRPLDPWSLEGIRVECVTGDGTRAVRVRREPFDGDELRVRAAVRSSETTAGGFESAEPAAAAHPVGLAFDLAIERPIPLEWLVAAWGGRPETAWGRSGLFSGSIAMACGDRGSGTGFSGRGSFQIVGLETAALAHWLGEGRSLEGLMTLEVEDLRMEDGRLTQATALVRIESGLVSQELLEQWVNHLGCRPGEAFPFPSPAGRGAAPMTAGSGAVASSGGLRPFDILSCRLLVRDGWVGIVAPEGRQAILTTPDGQVLLAAPSAALPLERLAWALAPPASTPVPLAPILEVMLPFLEGAQAPRARSAGGN